MKLGLLLFPSSHIGKLLAITCQPPARRWASKGPPRGTCGGRPPQPASAAATTGTRVTKAAIAAVRDSCASGFERGREGRTRLSVSSARGRGDARAGRGRGSLQRLDLDAHLGA